VEKEFKRALSYAISLLSKRDYSVKELIKKVKVKFPNLKEEELKLIEGELLENKFLDEKRAVINYFLSKIERGWGKRKIKGNLLKLGFPEELIDEVFLTVPFDYSFIVQELEKRYRLKNRKERERAKRFLLQRGFSFQEIHEILRMIKERD
jgi:regulatory protein